MLVISRVILGISSSNGVASITFLAEHVPAEKRNGAMAINFGLQRALVPLAPLMNLLVVRLPSTYLGPFPLTQYTDAGLLVGILNCLILGAFLAIFRELPTVHRETTTNSAGSGSVASEVCRTIIQSRAWVSYVLSFQNNWTNQVFLWTLPMITSDLYPDIGIIGNSLILSAGGIAGLIAAFSVPRLFRGVPDRWAILVSQALVGAVLLPYATLFGCSEGAVPPLWLNVFLNCAYNVGFLLQMPANNSIYTKLIGSRNKSIYVAILEVSKGLARMVSGFLVGAAYARLGPCALWGLTIGIWAFQFVPYLMSWKHLDV
eukprot:TRINITY_DN29241_c0_g1_i1.p1 TRINITY_DN29241_c0_g1~~TRINITY_DN29241_c0_g1_i1.p1  ORF type:complete len:349 (+),score=43.03 TRINITY_DN29241_c0_g1_i1:98-1048(+)